MSRDDPSGAKSIAFVSTMNGYAWGGSEELWSQTALRLVRKGWRVSASVYAWAPPHERILELKHNGVDVQLRASQYPVWKRIGNKVFSTEKSMFVRELEKFLSSRAAPDLVVLSDGAAFLPIDVLQMCITSGLPFATISQANYEYFWPDDESAFQYRRILPEARRCYFVSNQNRELFEKQLGSDLQNAEVIHNPFNTDFDVTLPWPGLEEGSELRLACVGRLHPPSKGQDVLLEALSDPVWRPRRWRLSFYGEGPMKDSVERMVHRRGLQDKVQFLGHVSPIQKIWANNHVLVMPSRYEGMPLAMVEAMICARPVLATNVAGHSEIVSDNVTGFLAESATSGSVRQALERLWARRGDLEVMGQAGSSIIRKLFPRDPVGVFVQKISALCM
jgi:glycosyltransferase involved in cell wall biosynthesis